MKKKNIKLLGCLLFLASCSSIKNVPAFSDMEGEWNIAKVNDTILPVELGSQQPFIGFDTKNGKIYGNSGCNQIKASLKLYTMPDSIEIKQAISTMMSCPNVEMEKKVLGALAQTKSFRKTNEKELALCNSSGHPVLMLEKRYSPMSFSELQGGWHVLSVFNHLLPDNQDKNSFLIFDTDGKTINGKIGCNRITGKLEMDENALLHVSVAKDSLQWNSSSDREVRNNILSALGSVKKYGRLDKHNIAFYTISGAQVLVLQKMETIEK